MHLTDENTCFMNYQHDWHSMYFYQNFLTSKTIKQHLSHQVNPLVLKTEYSRVTVSKPKLLMPWLLALPGDQQRWYWLYRIYWSVPARIGITCILKSPGILADRQGQNSCWFNVQISTYQSAWKRFKLNEGREQGAFQYKDDVLAI